MTVIYHTCLAALIAAAVFILLFFVRRRAAWPLAATFMVAAASASVAAPRSVDSRVWYEERTYTAEILSVRHAERSQRAIAEVVDSSGPFRCELLVAGAVAELQPGDIVRFRTCLRTPAAMHPLNSGPTYDRVSAGATVFPDQIEIAGHTDRFRHIPARIGRSLARAISATPFTDRCAALLQASLFGNSGDLASYDSFKGAGLAHLLCVSGFHVALVLALFAALLWPLRFWPRLYRWHPLILMLPLWLFVFVAGAPPSAVRAALMLTLVMAALMMERPLSPLNSLAGALTLIVVFDPYSLCSAALWLSVCAVAGLLMLAAPLNPYQPDAGVRYRLFSYPAACIAAFVGVLPLLVCIFHAVPLMSLPAGVCVIPVFPLFVVAGIGASALHAVGIPCGAWVRFSDMLADYITSVADFFASVPFGVLREVYPDAVSTVILCTAVAVLVFVAPNLRKWLALPLAAVAVVATAFAVSRQAGPAPEQTVFIDRLVVANYGDSAVAYVFSERAEPLDIVADYFREHRIGPDQVRAVRYPVVMNTPGGEVYTLRFRRPLPPEGAAVYVATNHRPTVDSMFAAGPAKVFVAPAVDPAVRRYVMAQCRRCSIPAIDLALGPHRVIRPEARAR